VGFNTNEFLPPNAIPWRMRSDLIVHRQDSGAWVVKDPVTLSYVRLSDREMAVLRLLNGRRSAGQIMQMLTNAWPDSEFTVEDLSDFLGQLITSQLIVLTQIPARADHAVRSHPTFQRWGSAIFSILRLRFRLLDPDPLLNSIQPVIAVLFSPAALIGTATVVMTALCLVTLRFDQFVANLPGPTDFFGPGNLVLVFAAFVIVKMFHEAGHAITARYCGAECHEAGVMLLLLTPILYTNVTDAWMLNRRSRLLISAAGIIVEIVLASIAAVAWFFAAPGLLKAILANVMLICTFGTILFNGNPLLRYDGYFLLSDAVGEPNLAQRSAHRVRQFLENLLFGSGSQSTPSRDRFLLIYGLCSGLYRVLLAIVILSMLKHLFDQWNLGVFGIAVMLVGALPLVVFPLGSFGTSLLTDLSMRDRRRFRLLRATVIVSGVIAMAFVPLPQSIVAPAVVEPSGVPVFSTLTGEFLSAVRYGDLVDRGSAVAVLRDSNMQRQRIEYEGAVKFHEVRVRVLELRRDDDTIASLPESRALLESARTRREDFDRELRRLTVTAPVAGTLLPPRARSYSGEDNALSQWTGYPLDERNRGALIAQGTLLGLLRESAECELLVQINAQDAALLQGSQVAEFQATGDFGVTWSGTVTRVAPLFDEDAPAELIVAGLTLPPSLKKPDPSARQWQAAVKLFVPEDLNGPVLYSTGFVRVQVEPASIASRLWRYLRTTFGSQFPRSVPSTM